MLCGSIFPFHGENNNNNINHHHHHHHHHHIHEGLGVFPVPWSSKWSWSLHLFFDLPNFLRPFGLYCSAYLVFYLCPSSVRVVATFSVTVFISFTMFCAPVFFLIHWFFSYPIFVIPIKCLKNFICAVSKRCSSLFFSTQASLPNFNAALAVMLWILNFDSLFICFPKCLRIAPFILLYVMFAIFLLNHFCILYTVRQVFKICYLFYNIVVYHNFTLCMARIIRSINNSFVKFSINHKTSSIYDSNAGLI